MKTMTNMIRIILAVLSFALSGMVAQPAWAAVDLADAPLFSSISVPGNLALALSVEYPTASTPAYTNSYAVGSEYLGYFDPKKCYVYEYNSSSVESSYFRPYGSASSHACATATSSLQLWSGNYLNWAAMQTLDTFRWVLTGGYRSVDTTTETRLTKTYHAKDEYNANKTLSSGLSGATPFGAWSNVVTRIRNRGIAMYFTSTGSADSTSGVVDYSGQNTAVDSTISTTTTTTTQVCTGQGRNRTCRDVTTTSTTASDNPAYAKASVVYRVFINVKVCDSAVGLESNCVAYGSNYKPEGLLQQYSPKLRYAAFGYYNHSSNDRNGAILRAPMKFIGPSQPVPGSSNIPNSAGEWSSATGVMIQNPDGVTSFSDSSYVVSLENSGVMNYLNKFGYSARNYKSYDPVSELYYAVSRYFRNKGNVAAYSSLATAGNIATATAWLDGFPAITTWQDPILYSCQKNFVLGIGDVYTHEDGQAPGGAQSYSGSPEITADLSGTAAAVSTADGLSKNVKVSTNMVGKLEGAQSTLGDATGRTYYMAGIAYDMHTRDFRTDLIDSQTLNTYWMDVHEGSAYRHKNQYWLAAKYGGFTIPDGFVPYASTNSTSTIPQSAWYTNSDVLPFSGTNYEPAYSYTTDSSGNSSDIRPDNYFPGNSPSVMKSGLTAAFAKISSEATAATATALSSPSPMMAASGNANYVATYDPSNWTGTLKGQAASYDSSGNSTYTEVWSADTLLNARTYTTRQIVTYCGSSGVAFNASMSCTASLAAVDGVSTQSAANYISYLRGDRTQEVANGGVYRTRSSLLGDIVNAKVVAVGAPDGKFTDLYNNGYSAFKRTYSSRATVVYVGSNDGMMHAFDGSITASTGGKELFAYIPGLIYSDTDSTTGGGLSSLGNPSFTHRYLVDGTPNVFDIDFFKTSNPTATVNDWRSVLIGGLGKGGKGYYAIDVTDPSAWATSGAIDEARVAGKVLWEFGNGSTNTSTTTTHMGYSYGAALVVKTVKYGWVVVLTSGYNNDDGKGYFFFVNPRTGALLETVATSEGSTSAPLNMAHASAFVPNFKDGTADAIYAGDLQGNVWRLDLTVSSGSYSSPTKFAILKSPDGTVQPVTTRPLTEVEPDSGKRYIVIGTGRLLADSDIASSQVQSFYAIIDGTSSSGAFYGGTTTLPGTVSFPVTRSVLEENADLLSGIGSNPAKTMGWYYNLPVTANVASRVNVDPTANNGIVAWGQNLPNGEVCSPAGSSDASAVSLGLGKTVLTDSEGNPVASLSLSSVITEIAFVNVSGKIRLQAGTATGSVVNVPGTYSTSTSLKRMNWRMVPAVD